MVKRTIILLLVGISLLIGLNAIYAQNDMGQPPGPALDISARRTDDDIYERMKVTKDDVATNVTNVATNVTDITALQGINAVSTLLFTKVNTDSNSAGFLDMYVSYDDGGTWLTTDCTMPWAGSIVGMSLQCDIALKATGTPELIIQPAINGSSTTILITMDTTNQQFETITQSKIPDTFSVDDEISVTYDSNACWGASSADIAVIIYIEMDEL